MSQNIIAVNFNNQTLAATLVNGIPHVALKPICENLGIDWSSQVQKIKRHPVLKQVMVMITTTSAIGADGKSYLVEMLMLPIDYLNGWLFGIDSTRVKSEAKELVISYQRECFKVLANHFMPKRNALVDLPASPYLSHDDRTTLKEAVNAHCHANKKDNQQAMYWQLFHRFRADKVELLPAGKLDEMLIYLGLKKPTPHDMVSVRCGYLTDLEQKVKALPNPKARFQIIPQKEEGLLKFVGEDNDDKAKYAMIPLEKWEDLSQAGSFANDEKVVQVKSGQVIKMEDFVEQVFQDPRHPYVMVKRDVMTAISALLNSVFK